MRNSNTGQTTQMISSGASMLPPQAWLFIVGVPIVLFAGFYFRKKLLQKVGIFKTKEDEAGEETWNIIRKQPFWTNNYYKTYGGDTITSVESSEYAKNLYEAMKGGLGWGTDEESIFGAFSSLGSKGNISKVAEAYNIRYKADLLNHLEDELDTDDKLEVATKISMYSS
tara:strand:+ start:1927 stop:2433 length:507 start_codon:yes stop_codon:yes gene_type:complete